MKINTKLFGTIEIEESKIITFEKGMIGYPDYKKYTLIIDKSEEKEVTISWLQSVEEEGLAFPVIDPLLLKPDYQPTVEDDYILPLGDLTPENMLVLCVMSVPSDLTKMSVNLKAPLIMNSQTCKGCQIIVENDVPVRYHIYDLLQQNKEELISSKKD